MKISHFCEDCSFCKQKREKILTSLKLPLLLLIAIFILPIVYAPAGNSTFYDLTPTCSVNQTQFMNCSKVPIKLNCNVDFSQFVQFMTFNFNSTTYLANQLPNPNQDNFTLETTLHQQFSTINEIYNWSSVVIVDTGSAIGTYNQNILINKSCPDCFSNVVQLNTSCQPTDTFTTYYNDTNQCTSTILPANTTNSCDYCQKDFQCTSFTPASCSLNDEYRTCNAVEDTNNCFNQTGLASDSFTGTLDDFDDPCTFSDYILNSELASTLNTELIISQYPYVEVNTSVTMEVVVTLNNTRVLIENVQMQIGGTTFVFNQDNDSVSYKKTIIMNDVGNYPFSIIGRDNGNRVFTLEGVFFSRHFVNVSVELFENRNMTSRYENDLGYVIALADANILGTDQFTKDLLNSMQPLTKTNYFFAKTLHVDPLQLNGDAYTSYKDEKRAIYAPYIDGRAFLRIPIETNVSWELRLLNSEKTNEYVFDGYNFAQIRTSDVAGMNDVYLTSGVVNQNMAVKLLVSNWDVRFYATATKWAIFGIIILVFFIAGYFLWVSTNDPSLVVKLLIAMIGALPILYLILTWLFN